MDSSFFFATPTHVISGLGHAGQPFVGGDVGVEPANRAVGQRLQEEGGTAVRPRATGHYAAKSQKGKPNCANSGPLDVSFTLFFDHLIDQDFFVPTTELKQSWILAPSRVDFANQCK